MTYLAYTFTSCKRLELVVSGSNNVSLHRLRVKLGLASSQASLLKA